MGPAPPFLVLQFDHIDMNMFIHNYDITGNITVQGVFVRDIAFTIPVA